VLRAAEVLDADCRARRAALTKYDPAPCAYCHDTRRGAVRRLTTSIMDGVPPLPAITTTTTNVVVVAERAGGRGGGVPVSLRLLAHPDCTASRALTLRADPTRGFIDDGFPSSISSSSGGGSGGAGSDDNGYDDGCRSRILLPRPPQTICKAEAELDACAAYSTDDDDYYDEEERDYPPLSYNRGDENEEAPQQLPLLPLPSSSHSSNNYYSPTSPSRPRAQHTHPRANPHTHP
jgi:hypothetical protein